MTKSKKKIKVVKQNKNFLNLFAKQLCMNNT